MLQEFHTAASSLNVMLVEDDLVDAEIVYRALARRNEGERPIQLIRVSRLASALQRLRQADDIQIIVLDLGLPDVTAEGEAVEKIRAVNSRVPIVIWSGQDYESAGLAALQKGADLFVPKELSNEALLYAAVRRAERSHRDQENVIRMIEASPDGMLIVNARRKVLFANPAAARMLDLDTDDLSSCEFLFPITPHRVEIAISGDGVAELWFEEVKWDGTSALLATLRDVTARYG